MNAARTAGFVLFGFVEAAGLGLLSLTRDLQTALYRVLYLSLGPTDATRIAQVTHFTAVAIISLTIPALGVLPSRTGLVILALLLLGFGMGWGVRDATNTG